MEGTEYGISCVPNTEPAQDKVNPPFGPWHDLVNKVISHEPKVADPWNFQTTLQKVRKAAIAKIRSPASKTGGTGHKTYLGVASTPPPPMCGRGLIEHPAWHVSTYRGKRWKYIYNFCWGCHSPLSSSRTDGRRENRKRQTKAFNKPIIIGSKYFTYLPTPQVMTKHKLRSELNFQVSKRTQFWAPV